MLRQALEEGRLSWIHTAAMWSELCHEVRPELCARYGVTPGDIHAGMARIPRRLAVAVPESLQVPAALRCSDPQDQMFLDLAYTLRPSLLLSRDRAVLKLRGKAAALGVRIERPDVWPDPSFDAAPAKPAQSRRNEGGRSRPQR
jgi:hypothetical protein